MQKALSFDELIAWKKSASSILLISDTAEAA